MPESELESRDEVEPLELFELLPDVDESTDFGFFVDSVGEPDLPSLDDEPDDALFSELAAPSPCAELPRSRFESLDEPLFVPRLVLSDFELLSRSPIDMPPDTVNVAELSA